MRALGAIPLTAIALASLSALLAASSQPYIQAKGLGAAAAARITSAQGAQPATVRISYTGRDHRQGVLVTHPQAADAFDGPGYPATAFYTVPGETNPLFRVTVSAEGGRNDVIEDIYVLARAGTVVSVPFYPVDTLGVGSKPISAEQHFAKPVRTLRFQRELDSVGGGSVQGFAQYFVRTSDGKPAILQTNWLVKDMSYDTPPHVSKPDPEPQVAGTCYRLYRSGTYTFFAVCSQSKR